MMEVTTAPVPAKQEQMDNAVADKRCKGESLVLRIRVVREERNFTPVLQLDNLPSLQEPFDRALLEQRFEDLPGIQEAMRAEHGGVQQQLALAIKEERWLDAAHFRDTIARSVEEQMDNAVADKRCKGESLVLRITHGPTLAIAADIVPAVHTMWAATAAPAAAQ